MSTQSSWSLAELAAQVGAELRGDAEWRIHGLHTLAVAGPAQLSFLANPRYKAELKSSQAGAVLLRPADAAEFHGNALVLANPYLAYAQLSSLFDRTPRLPAGIHPSAVVSASARVHESVAVGPCAVIGDDADIGAGTAIEAGAVIQARVRIGSDCLIRANAVIYHDCVLGSRVNIHAGTVIGADGFGFANSGGRWHKIAQIGRVVIGDDVDIGANTTIDRGALGDTEIHNGVIIDNLVQVAHNVVIGEHSAIAGCCGIAGSTKVGAYCVLAGGVGVAGHLTLADHVQFTGMSMVTKSIAVAGSYSSGSALEPTESWRKTAVRVRQIDEMAKRLRQLEQDLASLRA